MEIRIIEDANYHAPTEYFCLNCQQLRLNFTDRKICGYCGSDKIIIGEVGTLDRNIFRKRGGETMNLLETARNILDKINNDIVVVDGVRERLRNIRQGLKNKAMAEGYTEQEIETKLRRIEGSNGKI